MMQTFASDLLEHAQRERSIHRRELCLPEVNELRLIMSRAIRFLHETNDEYDVDFAGSLSVYRNRLLTEPVDFASYSDEVLRLLRTLHAPQHYGERFYKDYKQLENNLEALADQANPLHDVIVQDIDEAITNGRLLKIWCYAKSRNLYEELAQQRLGVELDDTWFLHSVSMYGKVRPFDELMLVGPMRARGWNRLPDAIVSAPRFNTIKQIAWDGVVDDPELGYDPLQNIQRARESEPRVSTTDANSAASNNAPYQGKFTSSVQRVGNSDATDVRFELEDEFVWSRQSSADDRPTRAFAMSLSDGSCVLWSPRTKMLSYNPSELEAPVAARSSMTDLISGMYAIVEIESAHDRETHDGIYASLYTDIWRSRLMERISEDPKDLVRKLRMRGLYLKTLSTRIHQWVDEDAPRKYEHFEMLVQELGLTNYDPERKTVRPGFQFAHRAFKVISSGWGKAISMGREVADRIELKRIAALNAVGDELRDLARDANKFTYELSNGDESDGVLEFDRIADIEHGFIVPQDCMHYKINRLEVDKWRL